MNSLLVDFNSFNNNTNEENSYTIIYMIDEMQEKMMTFPPLSQAQKSRKQLLQQIVNNLKYLSLKIHSKTVVCFQNIISIM